MITNIKNFIEGWSNLIISKRGKIDKDKILLAEERGEICIKCPEFVKEDRVFLKKYPFRCNVCGCVFPAIVLAKNKKCPLGKW